MQTLKIEIPQGYEVDSFDKLSGEIRLKEKPKDVMERVKTIDDVLADNGISPGGGFRQHCEMLSDDEVAYIQLKLIAKSLNEGWTPDWDNSSQYKYFPWFWMNGGSSGFRFYDYGRWSSASTVGSRLCFKSRELAEYAAKQFLDVYRRFMVIK